MAKDVYATKDLLPMTIGGKRGLLTDPDYIYELKFDGYRCMAYLDPVANTTDIRSKRNSSLMDMFPELRELHKLVKQRCVLDGELVILTKGGFPNFEELQGRSHMRNTLTIAAAARNAPATLVLFDVLYEEEQNLTGLPLFKRKQHLEKIPAVKELPGILQISVYADGDGTGIYAFAEQHGLEGAIAKKRDSIYMPGVRTKEWYKLKLLDDDDFVVCGYLPSKKANVATLILGQYGADGQMQDAGRVVLGRQREDFAVIEAAPRAERPPFKPDKRDADAVWLRPVLVCTVTFSYRTPAGVMRHAKYKGLRTDKLPAEAVAPQTMI